MLDIDISEMVEGVDCGMLSGSRMELGDDAGRITWRNSLEHAREATLLKTPDDIETAREYFADFGAWTREEIDGWSAEEVQALTVQHVAHEIRQMEEHCEGYDDYRAQAEAGRMSGDIYRDDSGRYYFTMY